MKPLVFQEDARYTYALGQLRARETRLLPTSLLLRWLDERLDTVLRGLEEAGYAIEGRPDRWEDVDFDGMVETRRSQEWAELERLCAQPAVLEVLDLFRRLRGLRALLRGRIASLPFESLPLPDELSASPAARAFVDGEGPKGLDLPLAEALHLGLATWNEGASLHQMDEALEAWGHARRLRLAQELGNPFLGDLVCLDVDLANLRRLLRLLSTAEGPAAEGPAGRSLFLEGGLLPNDRLVQALDDEPGTLAARFATAPYAGPLREGLEAWSRGEGSGPLERALDDHRMAQLRQARLAPFGPELLVAWHGALETEGCNLRNLFVGRVNDLPRDGVARRMRASYV